MFVFNISRYFYARLIGDKSDGWRGALGAQSRMKNRRDKCDDEEYRAMKYTSGAMSQKRIDAGGKVASAYVKHVSNGLGYNRPNLQTNVIKRRIYPRCCKRKKKRKRKQNKNRPDSEIMQ